jgi:hypothetical protein
LQNKIQVLDQGFLNGRCMILELAATLDRHDRAAPPTGAPGNFGAGVSGEDPRLDQLRQAIGMLLEPAAPATRAQRILRFFSDPEF